MCTTSPLKAHRGASQTLTLQRWRTVTLVDGNTRDGNSPFSNVTFCNCPLYRGEPVTGAQAGRWSVVSVVGCGYTQGCIPGHIHQGCTPTMVPRLHTHYGRRRGWSMRLVVPLRTLGEEAGLCASLSLSSLRRRGWSMRLVVPSQSLGKRGWSMRLMILLLKEERLVYAPHGPSP